MKFKDSKTIKIRNDFNTDSDQLFAFLELFLNEIGVLTKVEGSRIVFRSIKGSTTNFGENMNEAIRIIREGEVEITKLDDNKIKLKWEVRLNILLFWSTSFGIMMSFLSYIIAKPGIMTILLVGLFFWFIVFVIGYLWITILMRVVIRNTIKNY